MSLYNHILVAIDFSTAADHILSKALDLARDNKSKISLLHVVEYLPPIDYFNDSLMYTNWPEDEKLILKRAQDRMKQFASKHALENATLKVEIGAPKLVIAHYIEQHQCDLVVLGSHGRHGLSLLLGSTANAVLHAMPCDVLTIKIEE
ncbi:MAG: universal stress protein [Gammaproteobacteria bacterium]|nr:universal stress protein [Gammaproteobacteria bacterium]